MFHPCRNPIPTLVDAPHPFVRCKYLVLWCARGTVCRHLSRERPIRHAEDLCRRGGWSGHAAVLRQSEFCTNLIQASRNHIRYRHPVSDPEYRGWSCRHRCLTGRQRRDHRNHRRARRSIPNFAGDISHSNLEFQPRHKTWQARAVYIQSCSRFPASFLFCSRPFLHTPSFGSNPKSGSSESRSPGDHFRYLSSISDKRRSPRDSRYPGYGR